MVKIQLIHTEEETHNLSQDMARLMLKESKDYYDSIVECFNDPETKNTPIRFHSVILSARTPLMGLKLQEYKDKEHPVSILTSLSTLKINFRTDKSNFCADKSIFFLFIIKLYFIFLYRTSDINWI